MTAQEYIAWALERPYRESWWVELQRVLPERARQVALQELEDVPEWLQIEVRRELIRQGAL